MYLQSWGKYLVGSKGTYVQNQQKLFTEPIMEPIVNFTGQFFYRTHSQNSFPETI